MSTLARSSLFRNIMSRTKRINQHNGFFGIGILNNVDGLNIGTLWRSAFILGASFIFTIDRKYKKEGSDITCAWSKIPLYHYDCFDDFKDNIPFSTQIIAIEKKGDAQRLETFHHPDRAIYLLGNEKNGLPEKIISQCHSVLRLPGEFSLNVAVAGSIVMYDRSAKELVLA